MPCSASLSAVLSPPASSPRRAGSPGLDDNAVLGLAFGSSLAPGFVPPQGNITSWLNELAFVPVDYREDAPVDEWSGDPGVGAQYFSQQAVGRRSEEHTSELQSPC